MIVRIFRIEIDPATRACSEEHYVINEPHADAPEDPGIA